MSKYPLYILCPECFGELEDAEDKNIIEKVYEAMSTDSDGNSKQAQIMENEYFGATEDQRKAIDGLFRIVISASMGADLRSYPMKVL